ncbi:MAG TPA: DUF3040 domain-containing protein [Pseudonocardia sp.]
MLSEREARMLREIEERLTRCDPGLAAVMAELSPATSRRAPRRAEILIIVSASLLATVCMVLAQVGAGLVTALFAVGVFAVRRASRWRTGWRPDRWRGEWPTGGSS